MEKAREDVKADAKKNKRKISASFDGSWMKRGLVSLIGFVSAIGMYINKVIAFDLRCKYCQSCKGKATEASPCKLGPKCGINHRGSSGAMEPDGAINIIRKLDEDHGLRITHYLGDGDSKAFSKVDSAFDWKLKKLECVNHVAKRMGSRLLKRKKKVKGLGGKGKGMLTDSACKKIQAYYHWIITNSDGNVKKMKRRIDALYRHIASSDAKPDHDLCEAEYCKYASEKLEQIEKKGKKNKKIEMKYRHQDHFHLLESQMEKVKDIFEELSDSKLLGKVTHGRTQNSNECFNSTVWNLLPKNGFANRPLAKLSLYMGVCLYNEGYRPILEVLSSLGVPIGIGMKKYCLGADKLRVAKRRRESIGGSRKSKKKKLAAERKATARDYSPGGH